MKNDVITLTFEMQLLIYHFSLQNEFTFTFSIKLKSRPKNHRIINIYSKVYQMNIKLIKAWLII